MKKFTWILATAVVLAVIVAPTIALANNGPHGGFVADTDMCAACHRAHTAPSSVTWTDGNNEQRNALLISDSSEAYQFCLACHDNGAQGADTNFMGGNYEGTKYGTQNKQMISGAFGIETGTDNLYEDSNGVQVTSSHLMNGKSWGAYGGGVYKSKDIDLATGDGVDSMGKGDDIVMDCTTCHDPHGSSNYRILKDSVYGVAVGGYDGTISGTDPFGNAYSASNPKPTPYVISNEVGFPLGGFQLHTPYANYDADYTVAKYAKAPGGDQTKGMSGWCAGCHTAYGFDDANPAVTEAGDWTSKYNAGDGLTYVDRHRHPINVSLDKYKVSATDTGGTTLVIDKLPLGHQVAAGNVGDGVAVNETSDWIDCLTCHNAHGTTAVMKDGSYADPNGSWDIGDKTLTMVAPDSALLKMDNRGVCEACHNK